MPDQVIIEFVADTSGLEPAVNTLESIGGIDKTMADEFRKNNAAFQDRVKLLNETGKAADKAGDSAENLAKDFKKVSDSVKIEGGKKALDDFGKSINEQVGKSQRLTTQLRAMKNEISAMDAAGQSGSKAFLKMQIEAAKLEDQIGDTSKRIRTLASDTKNIDAVVGVVSGLASAFSVAQGAAALLGDENQDLQKALLKVQAAMAIANGVQQIGNLLQKESVVVLGFQRVQLALTAAATGLYSGATSLATIATAAWNRVLALNPIVAIATAITLAVAAIYQFIQGTDDSTESLKKQNEELKNQKKFIEEAGKAWDDNMKRNDESRKTTFDNYFDNLETEIQLLKIRGGTLTAIFNLEKDLIDKRLKALETSGNKDTSDYTALLNDKKVLTAQYYRDLEALARKSNEDLKKVPTGGAEGVGGDVSRIPETISAAEVEDFKTQLAEQGKEARKKIRQEESTDQVAIDEQMRAQLVQTAIQFGNQLFAFGAAINAARAANLDEQLKKGKISEQKYAKEIAEIKRKQAIADKEQAAFNIVINTAIAVTKVAAQTGILATVLAVAIAALGAAQLATVIAQPIPKFAKGTESVKGGTPGKDSVLAMLMPGERVVPADVNKKLGGIKNADLPNLNLIPALPYVSDSTMIAMERGMFSGGVGINYDLLAEKVAEKMGKEIKKHDKVSINIDERGFQKRVQQGLNTTKYIDDKFSWNG